MKKHSKSRHSITFLDSVDLEVAVRGSLGQTTKAISAATQLTESQVQYRLTKATIKRADYRNGRSRESQLVFNTVRGKLTRQFRKALPPQFL